MKKSRTKPYSVTGLKTIGENGMVNGIKSCAKIQRIKRSGTAMGRVVVNVVESRVRQFLWNVAESAE